MSGAAPALRGGGLRRLARRFVFALGCALGLGACGSAGSWSGALGEARAVAAVAEASAEARVRAAELELVVAQDPVAAASSAEALLGQGEPVRAVAVRAFLVLCRASDALGAFERPLAFLPFALDAAATPSEGRRVAAEADRAWARLDGQAVASPEIVRALGRVVERHAKDAAGADPAWEPAVAEALVQLATAERLVGPARGVAALRRAGFILDWRLSAPWGEAPELDFNEALGPEARALSAEERTGAGWDLAPLPTEQATFSDGEVTFFDLPQTGGTGFAEADLGMASDAARGVVLRLETNRFAKVFLDGDLVLSRGDGDAPWLAQRDVALASGVHRVTVKLSSEDGKGFFRLRASPLLAHAPGVWDPADAAGAEALRPGDGAGAVRQLSWITERLERPASDVSGAGRALQALAQVLTGAPGGPSGRAQPVLALLAARVARANKQLSPSAQRQEARGHWDAVVKAWPGNPIALRGLAHVAREEERPDEARALLQGARDPRTLVDALDDARRQSWEAESLGLAEQLAPIAAGSPRISQELIDTYRTFGRAGRARELADHTEAAFPGTATTRVAELMVDAGDPRGAADRLLALFQIQPERHPLLRSAVAALRAAGLVDRAAQEVDAFLSRRPGDGWALGERVRIALQRGDTAVAASAQTAIARALAQHPDFAPLESLAALIAGRPESFDVLGDSAARITAFRLVRESEAGRRYAPFPVIELLDREAIDVRADGTTVELVHHMRMVQAKAGADALGDVRPPAGARILRARTLKADGRVLFPERTEGKAELSFPDLQPGDVVETAWVTRSRTRQDEGGYLTGVPFAAWSMPTVALDVQIALPPGLALVAAPLGGAPAPTAFMRPDGGTTYRFEGADLPAIPREPQSTGARAFFPFVDLRIARPDDASDVTAWRAIARLYRARFVRLLGAARAPGAPATRALSAKLGPPRTDRARRAAFEWVKRELGDEEVMNVFETPVENAIVAKRGSRALVLVGLLRALGDTDATIVLCAPKRDGEAPDAAHPSPNANRFFYPLVRDGDAWLDPARPYTPYGALPAEVRGARCLSPTSVAPGADAAPLFVTVPSAPDASPTFATNLAITLAADGTATARLAVSAEGAGGTPLRQIWLAQDEARRQILWTQWVGSLFVGARVTSAQVTDADVAERPMRVALALDLGTWAGREGDALALTKLIKPMPTADFSAATELAELVALPARTTPLRIPAHDEALALTLTLPAGYRPEALPASIDQTYGTGADRSYLQQTAELRGQTIVVTRRVHLAPGRVDPSGYSAFRQFAGAAAQAFEAPLRLVPSR